MANRYAIIETSMGRIKAELFEDKAPVTTANFIKLAEAGFYKGLGFHRIIKGFVIQGGDPKGDGTGGSDTTIDLEVHADLHHTEGALAMARSFNPNSASSQFYICDKAQPGLDGQYAVFGQVVEGMDIVHAIAGVKTDSHDRPLQPVTMSTVTIAAA